MKETECNSESKSWADFIDKPPKKRIDCRIFPRPCLWTTCRFHLQSLMIDDSKWKRMSDDEKLEFLYSMEETCVLDVAEHGAKSSEGIRVLLHYKYSNPINNLLSLIFRKLRTSKTLIEMNQLMLSERSKSWTTY